MKRLLGVLAAVALVAGAGLAFAQMGGGMGPGTMGGGMMGPGTMGGGMMGGGARVQDGAVNQGLCPGVGQDAASAPSITEDKAREVAQQYADANLPGFTIDKVRPFGGMHGTMYLVELKGPSGEVQVLHIDPWGAVMPGHGSPGRAT